MPLNAEQLQELLNQQQERLESLRQSARQTTEDGKRRALEEAIALSCELVEHLQAELDVAKKAKSVLAH